MLTVKEVADLLHVHPNTVYQLAKQGELPGARKIGGVWRFHRDALLTAMNEWQQLKDFPENDEPSAASD